MHIRTVTRTSSPVKAYNIELIFDLILQFINLVEAFERFVGIDIATKDLTPGPGTQQ